MIRCVLVAALVALFTAAPAAIAQDTDFDAKMRDADSHAGPASV